MGVTTTPATGSRGTIHIAQEANFGVLVPPTHLIEFTSESLSAQESELMSEAIRDHRGMSQLVRGNLDIQGDINFEQNASGLGMILYNALGDYIKCEKVDGGTHGRVLYANQVPVADGTAAAAAADEAFSAVSGTRIYHVTNITRRLTTAITNVEANTGSGFVAVPAGEYTLDLALGRIIFNVALAAGALVRADIQYLTKVAYALPFTPDHASPFEDGGNFAVVYRDENRALAFDNAAGSGFEYDKYVPSVVTYVSSVVSADEIELARVLGPSGSLILPDLGTSNFGVLLVGSDRVQKTYYVKDDTSGEVVLTITGGTADISVNDYIQVLPALVKEGASAPFTMTSLAAPAKGHWIYEFQPTGKDWTGMFTHHMERGRYLPAGLTVEVHRDAAVFIYTGCKVNSLALTFDANSIVTGTASLIGKVEYSIATLLEDVIPGAGTIKIDKRDAFPNSGLLTIGEETRIRYSNIAPESAAKPEGPFIVTISGTGAEAIQRFHPRGQNVDSRSSRKAETIYSGNTSPLTAFETLVYIDGYWEEVLSANFTLNNNLTTDKFGLGSRFRLATVEGRAEIDGTLSMEFDDGKHYNKFLRGEKFSIEFKCVAESDDSLIGSTGRPSQAYYFLPKCKYNGTTPQIGGPDIINHDMPFRAIVDTEFGETDLVIILVNGLSADVQAP